MGHDLPRSWEQLLRGIASKLRAALAAAGLHPAGSITTAFGAYQMRLPPDTTIDVEEALASFEAAERTLDAGDAERATEAASATVAIAALQFLPGSLGAWVERRQAELVELHLRGLEVLALAAEARRRWAEAVAAAEQAVAIEPYRESAHLRLMAAHAAADNRGEAPRAYERCRRRLADQLGVNPSAPTEAAYLALLVVLSTKLTGGARSDEHTHRRAESPRCLSRR